MADRLDVGIDVEIHIGGAPSRIGSADRQLVAILRLIANTGSHPVLADLAVRVLRDIDGTFRRAIRLQEPVAGGIGRTVLTVA